MNAFTSSGKKSAPAQRPEIRVPPFQTHAPTGKAWTKPELAQKIRDAWAAAGHVVSVDVIDGEIVSDTINALPASLVRAGQA